MHAGGIFDIIKHQREMIKKTAFIMLCFALVPNLGYAACSHANLTRCLDSACAINISSNPAARCQYCGTADAGEPNDAGMRAVSVGTSARFSISSRELKNAPTDPGERYVWASKKCIALVSGCTADDVSDVYDPLIEQSCTAAGISSQMSALFASARQTKTSATCKSEITSCMVANNKCTSRYSGCAEDSDFNKFFSECSVLANGCDAYLTDIRETITKSRDTAIKNAEETLLAIVQSYRESRANRLAAIKKSCENQSALNACISSICSRSMPNQCDATRDKTESYQKIVKAEIVIATQLCQFIDIACSTLK